MRSMNLSDKQRRDALVGLERAPAEAEAPAFVDASGNQAQSARFVKTTASTAYERIVAEAGGPEHVAAILVDGDPEIDFEDTGRIVRSSRRIFLRPNGDIAYQVRWQEVEYDATGNEQRRREWQPLEANVSAELPVLWTGRYIEKRKAVGMFVSSRVYQLSHVNGLTYEFLHGMAADLQRRNAFMLLGGGPRGDEPLVLSRGGLPYRAFLEGRVRGRAYRLALHLSNLELKDVP